MGQAANNRGRNASLDQKKSRAAGRGTHGSAPDFETAEGRGQTAGAFGNPSKDPRETEKSTGARTKKK